MSTRKKKAELGSAYYRERWIDLDLGTLLEYNELGWILPNGTLLHFRLRQVTVEGKERFHLIGEAILRTT